jgi:ABC-type transporter lipoprotein component MlaA
MALPIAKTFAIKDATGHLGKIFGRDLNRKDTIPFQADQVIIDRVEKRKQLLKQKKYEKVTD